MEQVMEKIMNALGIVWGRVLWKQRKIISLGDFSKYMYIKIFEMWIKEIKQEMDIIIDINTTTNSYHLVSTQHRPGIVIITLNILFYWNL